MGVLAQFVWDATHPCAAAAARALTIASSSRFIYKYYRNKQKCLWLLSEMLISEIAHILGTLYRTFVIIQYLLNYAAFWPHKGRTTLLFDYNRLNDHFI